MCTVLTCTSVCVCVPFSIYCYGSTHMKTLSHIFFRLRFLCTRSNKRHIRTGKVAKWVQEEEEKRSRAHVYCSDVYKCVCVFPFQYIVMVPLI